MPTTPRAQRARRAPHGLHLLLLALALPRPAPAQPGSVLDIPRADHQDRLRAMWLAESIGTWTGLRTEGARQTAPFLTDADWNTWVNGQYVDFVADLDPWPADDDTDIEYVYAHLTHALATNTPSAEQLRDAWVAHINRFIWVSNARARELMNRGVVPGSTGLPAANPFALFIDAQLTTEVFGAIAPGMPALALRYADLPIRTTAHSYAADAAALYVVMYALAPEIDPALPGRDAALHLLNESLRYIAPTSKAADVARFVRDDFLANPDPADWERTRDRVHLRYQANAAANGFVYRGWTESSVNLATGLIALLYGSMDLRRSIQIGTLSGWDSDNGTATVAGLIGLTYGSARVLDAFPGAALSDRYNAARTRDNLPDHLPADPDADDTFTLLSQRMMPAVDRAVREGGGRVDTLGDRLLVRPRTPGLERADNPRLLAHDRSATLRLRAQNRPPTAISSVPQQPGAIPSGAPFPTQFINGREFDAAGLEQTDGFVNVPYSSQLLAGAVGPAELALSVLYPVPVRIDAVRFVEGDHFQQPGANGGWFASARIELRVGNAWVPAPAQPQPPLDPDAPFQSIDFRLQAPALVTGVRIVGAPGGSHRFVTCAELDASLAPAAREQRHALPASP